MEEDIGCDAPICPPQDHALLTKSREAAAPSGMHPMYGCMGIPCLGELLRSLQKDSIMWLLGCELNSAYLVYPG